MTVITKKMVADGMDCIIVGGCANGLLLKKIHMDAQWIELERPEHIKPLASSGQINPEIAKTSDRYEVHAIHLQNTEKRGMAIFGIAVVEGKTLTWAFSQLCTAFVERVTQDLIRAGHIQTN